MAWLLSGLGSGLAFVLVGLQVAPQRTERIKQVLVIILGVIGGISALGPILASSNLLPSIAGTVMVIVAIAAFKMPVTELVE